MANSRLPRTMRKGTRGDIQDANLYQMVNKGWRDPFNKTKRLTMPAFGDVLSPEQIRAVITYLKTLWTAEQRQFQMEESQGHPYPSEAR